jgi:hypothetical protein
MDSDHSSDPWRPIVAGFPSGRGSEGGIVRLDEEHLLGARVTLEEGGGTAPWSITCGLYGWMCHTVFCGSESEARRTVGAIKDRLHELASMANGEPSTLVREEIYRALDRFVADF